MSPRVELDGKSILINGKKVGSLLPDGTFQLVDANGVLRQGNVAELIQARVKSAMAAASSIGPSGQLRLGTDTFEVISGTVFVDGAKAGSVTSDGAFSVQVRGQPWEGNFNDTPGAVWLGGPSSSGAVTANGRSFPALAGAISEAGQIIGWLDASGRFRAVRPNGDFFEGRQGDPSSTLYLARV